MGISSRNEDVGPVVDAINTWYGRGIPIGYQRGLQVGYPADTGETITSKYAEAVRRRSRIAWPGAAMLRTRPSSIARSWPRSRTRAS